MVTVSLKESPFCTTLVVPDALTFVKVKPFSPISMLSDVPTPRLNEPDCKTVESAGMACSMSGTKFCAGVLKTGACEE